MFLYHIWPKAVNELYKIQFLRTPVYSDMFGGLARGRERLLVMSLGVGQYETFLPSVGEIV